MHEPTPPTANEYGDEVHPAFGYITAHRISSTPGSVLFDSEIRHTQFVRVTLGRMSRKRDLRHDWLHPSGGLPLVEVDMSEAQWASFVSSVNTSAVPCTLRVTENQHDIPGLEFAPRLALSAKEAKDAAREAFEEIKEAFDALEALDSRAGVKARKEAMRTLRARIQNAVPNVDFATSSLSKHTENVVQKARADIEAMVVTHAVQMGFDPNQALQAIVGQTVEPATIEAGAEQ